MFEPRLMAAGGKPTVPDRLVLQVAAPDVARIVVRDLVVIEGEDPRTA
ncbi:MAG: hypothetical protein R2735_07185 [Microthrixaceae bacterium]